MPLWRLDNDIYHLIFAFEFPTFVRRHPHKKDTRNGAAFPVRGINIWDEKIITRPYKLQMRVLSLNSHNVAIAYQWRLCWSQRSTESPFPPGWRWWGSGLWHPDSRSSPLLRPPHRWTDCRLTACRQWAAKYPASFLDLVVRVKSMSSQQRNRVGYPLDKKKICYESLKWAQRRDYIGHRVPR